MELLPLGNAIVSPTMNSTGWRGDLMLHEGWPWSSRTSGWIRCSVWLLRGGSVPSVSPVFDFQKYVDKKQKHTTTHISCVNSVNEPIHTLLFLAKEDPFGMTKHLFSETSILITGPVLLLRCQARPSCWWPRCTIAEWVGSAWSWLDAVRFLWRCPENVTHMNKMMTREEMVNEIQIKSECWGLRLQVSQFQANVSRPQTFTDQCDCGYPATLHGKSVHSSPWSKRCFTP